MTKNVYRSLLGVFMTSVILGSIEGHPHRSESVERRSMELPSPETITSNRSQTQLPASRVRDTLDVEQESRMIATVPRVRHGLGSDGKIVFPSDWPDNGPTKVTLHPAHECKNTTYCEYPSYYPKEFIKQAIKTRQDLHFLSTIDAPPEIGQRIDGGSEDDDAGNNVSLCDSEETVIFPKTGENKAKEWLYIVNEENFPQGVRIEACMTKNTACSVIEGFAAGYKTSCKQKYIYRQLAAVASNGSVGPDLFRFPASCCCHVKFSGNPLTTRLGIGADKVSKQSPAPRAEETGRETGKK